MTTCTYDNPSTWCREVWVDGRKVLTYTAELVCEMPPSWFRHQLGHYGVGIGPWSPCQLVGNIDALPSRRKLLMDVALFCIPRSRVRSALRELRAGV